MRYNLIFLLFLILFNTNTIKPNPLLHNEQIIFGIIGAISLIVIGNMLCTAYYDYLWPNKDMIKYCRTSFKMIHNSIKDYNALYENDIQLSDLALKEKIFVYYSNQYPFLTYHSTIAEVLYQLNNHLKDIQKSLQRIIYRQQCLTMTSSKDLLLFNIFTQLKAQALQLKISLKRTIFLLETLKNRISLFPEYYEDYYNWKEDQRIEEEKIDTTWSTHEIQNNSQENEQNYLEQQILNFQFDYY